MRRFAVGYTYSKYPGVSEKRRMGWLKYRRRFERVREAIARRQRGRN